MDHISKIDTMLVNNAAALKAVDPDARNLSSCNIYSMKTDAFMVFRGWEGVPENMLINLVGWVMVIVLFGILRKRAWNYKRSALVQRSDPSWIQLFYGEPQTFVDPSTENVHSESEEGTSYSQTVDKGCCSWMTGIFKVKDAEILKKCGKDAVQYLSFQRHCIIYMVIVCILTLIIVLPVNMHGELELNTKFFGTTTLSNLDPTSNLMWVHVTFAFFFLPLGIFFMRHFSANLSSVDHETLACRTLMISSIPEDQCLQSNLYRHFREAYSECTVTDIQFSFDVRRLTKLQKQRCNASLARCWCETTYSETGVRPRVRPHTCGRICPCCRPSVDALEHYTEEEQALATAVDRERSVALQKPLGIAFVTFATESMAENVFKEFSGKCRCMTNPRSSSVSRELHPNEWIVQFAPSAQDIIWSNLAVSKVSYWLRNVFVNLVLFFVLFFITTPAFIFENLDLVFFVEKAQTYSSLLSGFLPTLMLWAVSILLPFLVTYSDEFLSHWTRSEYNHSIMRKAFTFLLFMIVILPSLGLTSAKGFIDWALMPTNETFRWQCLFLSDNGAFFVKYVTTSGLVGCSLELIRFPELFIYALYLCFSRSEAENASVRRAVMWEFSYGVHYAWYLLIFSLTMIYSLSCPLIVPFGLLYLTFKHCIDRHNIYFVYSPSKISPKIHATAINIVVLALILQQMCIFFFSFVRTGWSELSIVTLIIFVLTSMFFFAQISLSMFKQFSPIIYKRFTRRMDMNGKTTETSQKSEENIFLPCVLKPDGGIMLREGVTEFYGPGGPTFGNKGRNYGASEDSVPNSPVRDTTELESAPNQRHTDQEYQNNITQADNYQRY